MDSVDIVAIIGASLAASLIAIRYSKCTTIRCCGLECHREVRDAQA